MFIIQAIVIAYSIIAVGAMVLGMVLVARGH